MPFSAMPDRQRRRRLLGPACVLILQTCTAAGLIAALAADARAAQRLERPLRVPLHWRPISWGGSGAAPRKLGIYAALGGSTTPRLFEFDTGGAGFYPTYATGGASSWWGNDVTATGYTFTQKYDGDNIKYKGDVVLTSLGLFADVSAAQPLLTAFDVVVGQTTSINDQPIDASPHNPPLEAAFWGDFGMAPKQGKPGKDDSGTLPGPVPILDSLLAQLQYGSAVIPGFRVHASSERPWVQIGLGKDDLNLPAPAMSFSLNLGSGSSATGIPYYDEFVITGTLAISATSSSYCNGQTGMIFDTGAFTTIHDSGGHVPAALVSGGQVIDNALVQISGLATAAGSPCPGTASPFLQFAAGSTVDQDLVWVNASGGDYLNTGILPFLSNDIIYNLGHDSADGHLTIVPQSVPEPLSAAGTVAAVTVSARLRRLRRRIRERDGSC
ncbi:hypothetical protein NZK32_13160 [Cyanobium sp. FGCU-52]|nr:hypothetical protein [Cyanobium sp. FGCU52]